MKVFATAALLLAGAHMTLAQTNVLPEWSDCLIQIPGQNKTHSLLDIITETVPQRNNGQPSFILNLTDSLDQEATGYLTEFDLGSDGYTAIIPENMYIDPLDNMETDILAGYGIDPASLTPEVASKLIKAHILPGTLTYNELIALLDANNGTTAIESIQGYEWTFQLKGGNNEDISNSTVGGAYPVVVDPAGENEFGFPLAADVNKAPTAKCPNTVIMVRGFIVTPDLLVDPVARDPLTSQPPTNTTAGTGGSSTGGLSLPDSDLDSGVMGKNPFELACFAAAVLAAMLFC